MATQKLMYCGQKEQFYSVVANSAYIRLLSTWGFVGIVYFVLCWRWTPQDLQPANLFTTESHQAGTLSFDILLRKLMFCDTVCHHTTKATSAPWEGRKKDCYSIIWGRACCGWGANQMPFWPLHVSGWCLELSKRGESDCDLVHLLTHQEASR